MLTTTLPILKLSIIDMRDQASLAIVDLSSYSIVPSSSDVALQVTPPGWPTVNVTFNPGQVNIYHCDDLGITCPATECCPLPDGIYDVKYTVLVPAQTNQGQSYASIEKTFIKVDQIKCKFQKAFLKIDLECNCGYDEERALKRELKAIDLLIAGCVAQANACNPEASYRLYRKADSLLDKLGCKFGLPCSGDWGCSDCNN